MPVIVIGADAGGGREIVDALLRRQGEVRVFVTDADAAAAFRDLGIKVATGDVSDESHIGGAALACFSAVAVVAAASDDRGRAFADTPAAVLEAWAAGLRDAGVRRVIAVAHDGIDDGPLRGAAPEHAVVGSAARAPVDVAAEVARLDEAASL